jgi:hypothetical protein
MSILQIVAAVVVVLWLLGRVIAMRPPVPRILDGALIVVLIGWLVLTFAGRF